MLMDALTAALAAVCDLLCWRIRYRTLDLQGPANSWYGLRRRVRAAPRNAVLSAQNSAPSPVAEM